MNFKVFNIEWDTATDDDELPDSQLPTVVTVQWDGDCWGSIPAVGTVLTGKADDDGVRLDIEDIINQVSDLHGWCISDCEIERIED